MTVRRKAHIESRVTLWSVYILYFLNIIGSHWRALSSRVTFLWIFIRKKNGLKEVRSRSRIPMKKPLPSMIDVGILD